MEGQQRARARLADNQRSTVAFIGPSINSVTRENDWDLQPALRNKVPFKECGLASQANDITPKRRREAAERQATFTELAEDSADHE